MKSGTIRHTYPPPDYEPAVVVELTVPAKIMRPSDGEVRVIATDGEGPAVLHLTPMQAARLVHLLNAALDQFDLSAAENSSLRQ